MHKVKITIESQHTGVVDVDGTPQVKQDFEINGEQSDVFATICEFFMQMPAEHFNLWALAIKYKIDHDNGNCPYCQTGECKTHTNEKKDNSGE